MAGSALKSPTRATRSSSKRGASSCFQSFLWSHLRFLWSTRPPAPPSPTPTFSRDPVGVTALSVPPPLESSTLELPPLELPGRMQLARSRQKKEESRRKLMELAYRPQTSRKPTEN